MTEPDAIALRAANLHVAFKGERGWIDVVRGIDLEVGRGEMLALVGESGSGKSLTGLALTGLLPASARASGSVHIGSQSVGGLHERQWNDIRGRRIAMIFQNPMTSLNPVLTIGEQLTETIRRHQKLDRLAADRMAVKLLERMKLPDTARQLGSFPHELSGGMRQRVMIAIAVANKPEVLIADEPTTALDASVQNDILDLIDDIRTESGMAVVLITHDLRVVANRADRIAVMYAGSLVEEQPAGMRLEEARHPYTLALVGARPQRRPRVGPRPRLTDIPGQVPSPADVGAAGCSFAPRCAQAMAVCTSERPPRLRSTSGGMVACQLAAGAAAAVA